MQNQDYVLNNTSYGSDLSYEVGCERLDGKKEMLCGLKGLARWEGNELIDNDKFVIVYQEYGNDKEYQTIQVLWLIDKRKQRFTDDVETYKKIMKEKQEKGRKRKKVDNTKTIATLTYSDKAFDTFARRYYIHFDKQFKGKVITCKKILQYSFTHKKWYNLYFLEFLHKNGKKDLIYLH